MPRYAQLIQTFCFASASKLRRDSALRPHFEGQGKALINFKTSKPVNVHYSFDCTNGHFSGVAQTARGLPPRTRPSLGRLDARG